MDVKCLPFKTFIILSLNFYSWDSPVRYANWWYDMSENSSVRSFFDDGRSLVRGDEWEPEMVSSLKRRVPNCQERSWRFLLSGWRYRRSNTSIRKSWTTWVTYKDDSVTMCIFNQKYYDSHKFKSIQPDRTLRLVIIHCKKTPFYHDEFFFRMVT